MKYIIFCLFFASLCSASEKNIAIIFPNSFDTSYSAVMNGAKESAKNAEIRLRKNFNIQTIYTPHESLSEKLQELKNKKISGAIIYLEDSKQSALKEKINSLFAENFFVVLLNYDIPESKRIAFIGNDEDVTLRFILNKTRTHNDFNDIACYYLFHGNETERMDIDEQKNYDGINASIFRKLFERFPSKNIFKSRTYSDFFTTYEKTLKQDDNFAVLIMSADVLSNLPYIQRNLDTRLVIAIGGNAQFYGLLKDATLDALITNDYYGWGRIASKLLIEKLSENLDSESPIHLISPIIYTPADLKKFTHDWTLWLR